jgi:hypothetical protein
LSPTKYIDSEKEKEFEHSFLFSSLLRQLKAGVFFIIFIIAEENIKSFPH